MWSAFSTQKAQTLRCARFGLPSRGGILLLASSLPKSGSRQDLKGDLVRVDVTGRLLGHRRQLIGGSGSGSGSSGPAAVLAGLQELDVVRDHFGGAPFLPVLALPGA